MAAIFSTDTALAVGKDDSLHGHKVVAMPSTSFGGIKVRDVVSSRNTDYRVSDVGTSRSMEYRNVGGAILRNAEYRSSTSNFLSRSMSAGRSSVSRSRDIVQDVYDRMGVNYIRGRSSIADLLEDNKTLGGTTKQNEDQPWASNGKTKESTTEAYEVSRSSVESRGKTNELNEQEDNCRSLSRAKGGVSSVWPPTNPRSNTRNLTKDSETIVAIPKPDSLQKERSSYVGAWMAATQPPRAYPRHSYAGVESRDDINKDESESQDDDRDCTSVKSTKSAKSIKERINEYGASTRASVPARMIVRSNSINAPIRQPPPKVDIFADSNTSLTIAKDPCEETPPTDQNSFVSGGMQRLTTANSLSRASKSSIADAFLSAISSGNPKGVSVVEFPSDGCQSQPDLASIAASSVSGEDFAAASPKRKPSGYTNKFSSAGLPRSGGPSIPITEKLFDERIQAQVMILNKKFEAEIRRIENCLERDYKSRISDLERKTNDLTTVLSKIMPRN